MHFTRLLIHNDHQRKVERTVKNNFAFRALPKDTLAGGGARDWTTLQSVDNNC